MSENLIEELVSTVKIGTFFKGVYDKTTVLISNMANAIVTALSVFLMDLDKAIIELQKVESPKLEKPRKVFEEITNSQPGPQKTKSEKKLKKTVTIDDSCITETSECEIKPVTYDSIFNKLSIKRFEPYS